MADWGHNRGGVGVRARGTRTPRASLFSPVVPAFNRFDIDNKQVENFNARLSEIVDARVDVVVDFESVLELKDSPDGLHYTEEYQNKVYRMYHEVISS